MLSHSSVLPKHLEAAAIILVRSLHYLWRHIKKEHLIRSPMERERENRDFDCASSMTYIWKTLVGLAN